VLVLDPRIIMVMYLLSKQTQWVRL